MQQLTVTLLGLPENTDRVRIGWPVAGQPTALITDDIVTLRCIEVDSVVGEMRDQQEIFNGTTGFDEITTFMRTWQTFWEFTGPNSYDNARKLKSGLFTQATHDAFAAQGLQIYLVTKLGAPQRVPVFRDGEWWQRVDFEAQFNELVYEDVKVNAVASVEIITSTDIGVISDFIEFALSQPGNFVFTNTALQGPAGPTGPAGPQGPAGAQGPAGSVVRNTAAAWTAGNIVLAAGTIGVETDTNQFKLGDGSTAWNSLPYLGGSSLPQLLIYRFITAATTNAANIVTGPVQFFGGILSNSVNLPIWVKLYDKAGAPVVGTDVPKLSFEVQAGVPFVIPVPSNGVTFTNGLSIAVTRFEADTDTTAVGAGDGDINIFYH